jgi:hypothetical protein
MDLKLKRKNVEFVGKCYKVGYCKLSNLLECEKKLGYTTGVYGWNADVYNYDNVNIVTGI